MNSPLGLIAEITHRCPLHCVYCSNPLQLIAAKQEINLEGWSNVFREAGELGILQLFLTGGEPLARPDLTMMVVAARQANLYVNLITSGIGLSSALLQDLVAAGLDHIQLSFQDSDQSSADLIAGTRAHARKLEIAGEIIRHRVGFTINIVVHRRNIGRLEEMIAMAEQLGPQKLEIANVQYYGWGLTNRSSLLPTREQVEQSQRVVEEHRARLAGKMQIEFVTPDYFGKFPKACMGGWGQKMMLINPSGDALPCHAANVIPGMQFDNVRDRSLRWIWEDSKAFQRFRGEDWMQQPCRTCDRRAIDYGGCRCQAFTLAGDASATDPVCSLAPKHNIIEAATLAASNDEAFVYRRL